MATTDREAWLVFLTYLTSLDDVSRFLHSELFILVFRATVLSVIEVEAYLKKI